MQFRKQGAEGGIYMPKMLASLVASISLVAGPLVAQPALALSCASGFTLSGSTCTQTYYATTSTKSLTIPAGVTSLSLTLRGGGAGNGGSDNNSGGAGGNAGYLTGTLTVNAGEVAYFYPGYGGSNGASNASGNGGGAGGSDTDPYGSFYGGTGGHAGSVGSSGGGGGGGAATTVRIGSTLKAVAGGAGGGSGANNCTGGYPYNGSSSVSQNGVNYGSSGGSVGGYDGGAGGGGGGGWNGGSGGGIYTPCGERAGYGGYRGNNNYTTGFTASTNSYTSATAGSQGYVTVSYTAPPAANSISITSPSTTRSNATSYVYSVGFDASVTGFGSEDITVLVDSVSQSNWSHSISGSGSSYTVTSSTSSGNLTEGTISFQINNAGVTSSTSGTGSYTSSGSSGTRTVDTTAPTISFTQPGTPNRSNPIAVTLTSSETLYDLAASDFTATGCSVSVTGSSSPYTINLSNCTDGSATSLSYTGSVADQAGNVAVAPSAVSFTADRTYQAGTLNAPSTPSNLETLSYSYTPGEVLAAGATLISSEISVSGSGCSVDASSIAWSGTSWDFDVIGCNDSATTVVSILAGAFADEAGNTNSQINASNVVLDRNVGVGIISEPVNTSFNAANISFTLNFTESVSGLEDSELAITGGSQGCTLTPFDTQDSITSYQVFVTGCADGASVRLTLAANAVYDALNNYGPTSPVQTSAFVIDLVSPEVATITPRDTRQNSSTVVYDVAFTEAVTGVTAGIFSTSSAGCSAPSLSGSGASYVVTLTSCQDGTVQLEVAATADIEDAATNALNPAAASSTMNIAAVIVDTVSPTSSWQAAPTGPLNSQTSYTIDFSEAIDASSFAGSDISSVGSATGCVFTVSSLDADTFTITSTGCGDGTVQPVIAAGSILDLAGNSLASSMTSQDRTAGSVTLDFTAPSGTISSFPASPTNATTLSYRVTFNEQVQTPSPSAFSMIGGVVGCAIVVSPDAMDPTTVFDLEISDCTEGLAVLVVNSGGVSDIAGNLGPANAVTASGVTIDQTPANSRVDGQTASPTKETTLVFAIEFDEAVSSLVADSSHFQLTGAGCSLGTLTGTQPGTAFTMSVLGCDVATEATLDVVAFSAVDTAGNASPDAHSGATITTDRVPAAVSSFEVTSPNDNGAITYLLEFNEPVTGLTPSDFTVSGVVGAGAVSVNSLSATSYEISMQALSSGTASLVLAANSVSDGPGNLSPVSSATSAGEVVVFDSLAGAFTLQPTLNENGKTNSANQTWRIGLNRAIDTTDATKTIGNADLTLTQGTCSTLSVTSLSASSFEITGIGCSDGALELTILQDAAEDPDGNTWPATDLAAALVTIDTTTPTVTATAPTNSGQLVRHRFEFDFSEAVSGLTLDDFSVSAGSTATGCVLSYTASSTNAVVTASSCSNGTIGISLAQNSVLDSAGNQGPAASVATSSITQATIAPAVAVTPAVSQVAPTLMATAPVSFVGPLTIAAQEGLVAAGIVRSVDGVASTTVRGDLTALANPTDPANLFETLTIGAGEALTAELAVEPSLALTHEVVGYLRTSTGWIDLGTTEIDPNGVVTVPAVFSEPGSYFLRIIVKQPTMQAQSFSIASVSEDYVMGLGIQSLEIDITVTGQSISLVQPSTAAPSYVGPVVENKQSVSQTGGQVTYTGKLLDEITKVSIGSTELEITLQSQNSISLTITEMSPGDYSLTFYSSFGNLQVQDALTVTITALYVGDGTFVTKKISDTQIKIYAKNIVGIGKVQFFVNGKEIAWIRAIDGTNPKLRFIEQSGDSVYYLVRTVDLDQRLRIEIKVDGQRAKYSSYSAG